MTIGPDTVLAGQVGIAGSAKIGSGVTLAGQVGVAGHLTIGNGATATAQMEPRRDAKEGSQSFRFVRSPDEGAAAAAFDLLFARVRENDEGGIYGDSVGGAPEAPSRVLFGALAAALIVLALGGALWRRRKAAS